VSRHYTEQTQRILQDLLDALEKGTDVDRAFLEDVRRMTADGTLANRAQVRAAIERLENRPGGQADELHN
jgi:hypothetical protein